MTAELTFHKGWQDKCRRYFQTHFYLICDNYILRYCPFSPYQNLLSNHQWICIFSNSLCNQWLLISPNSLYSFISGNFSKLTFSTLTISSKTHCCYKTSLVRAFNSLSKHGWENIQNSLWKLNMILKLTDTPLLSFHTPKPLLNSLWRPFFLNTSLWKYEKNNINLESKFSCLNSLIPLF